MRAGQLTRLPTYGGEIMGNPVVHFEVLGKDGEQLQAFYAGLFDWKINADNPMKYGLTDTDANDAGINGGIGGNEDGSSSLTFYIEVDDLESKLAEVEAAGGKVTAPVTEIPGMVTFAQFQDPSGNIVGLVKSEP